MSQKQSVNSGNKHEGSDVVDIAELNGRENGDIKGVAKKLHNDESSMINSDYDNGYTTNIIGNGSSIRGDLSNGENTRNTTAQVSSEVVISVPEVIVQASLKGVDSEGIQGPAVIVEASANGVESNGDLVPAVIVEASANGVDSNGDLVPAVIVEASANGVDSNGVLNQTTIKETDNGRVQTKPRAKLVRDDSYISDLPNYLQQPRSRKGAEIGSEDLITNDDLLLSATLVADAMDGHALELKREPKFVRSYNWFKSAYLRMPLYTTIVILLSLALFEDPAEGALRGPYWTVMSVEAFCLITFIGRLFHHAHWRLSGAFKRDVKNLIAIGCIVITVLDMIAYILVDMFTDVKPIRWSRFLRALLIVNFFHGSHLRRAWSNIRMTLKQIAHVILLFYFLILVFALVAIKMFQNREDMKFPNGSDYFKSYFESFWALYILVTTANNPDAMMPAYDKSAWYCIFFTIYIVLCLYLMLNILLAVTYNSYRDNMKNQIRESAKMKAKILNQAFEVIKINVDGNDMVTYKTWTRLIKLSNPAKTKYQIDLLMMVLDTDRSGYITRKQFLSVADLLNVPLSEVVDRKSVLKQFWQRVYVSRPSKCLHACVQSIYFSLFYDGVVVVNVVFICINIDVADWSFFSLYMIEIILKWYTFGSKRFFNRVQHWADVIITILSLVMLIVTELNLSGKITPEILSVINVFRIFRILRCLVEFQRFKIIFDAVVNVSFSIITYCGILFTMFYAFAIIGMEIFGDKIQYLGYNGSNTSFEQKTCGNPALNGSSFVDNRYCKLNFNGLLRTFVVLATLLVVNNWHIICEAFVLVTNSAARLYFMAFHLCVAVVVMNIVTAFILDMFMYEYAFSKKGNIDTKVEMTIKRLKLGIDDETGQELTEAETPKVESPKARRKSHHRVLRRFTVRYTPTKPDLSSYDGIKFRLKKRGWTKTEQLLQQLFEVDDEEHKHTDELDDLRL